MSAPTGNQSRRLHQSMRELVALYFAGEGFDATATPVHAKISTSLDAGLKPDVVGVPDVWVDVSARGAHRLSVDLDSARQSASIAGYPVSVLVQHRGGRGVDEAFAILTLADFAKLARSAEQAT